MIKVTDKLGVRKDGDAWAICERRVPRKGPMAGQEVWTNTGWFVRLSEALVRGLEISLDPERDKEIMALIASIDRMEKNIERQCKEIGEK